MKEKFFRVFGILFIMVLLLPQVRAVSVTKAGETVIQKGTYHSTRFVAGNRVTNQADVDGLSFIAGNDVTLEGKTSYGFYAGNTITIREKIEKDLFVAGNNIHIDSDAIIGRDAYVLGNTVDIDANITRDLRIGASFVDLSGITIKGDVYVDASDIVLDEKTVITGKLSYLEDTNVKGLKLAKVGNVKVREAEQVEVKSSFKDVVLEFFTSVVAAFIVLVVLFHFIPSSKKKLDSIKLSTGVILKTIGIGLVTLLVVPMISLIALFTGVLTPLALITIAIYVIGIYLSSLLVYYVIGNLFTSQVLKKDNQYLAIICGIILVKIIKLIPVIGGIVSAIILFYGMGLIYQFIQVKRK